MAWTTPGTATAGEVLTAAFWNTNVRDNLNELAPLELAWTDFTPQLRQGSTNIASTRTFAKYLTVGKTLWAIARVVSTAAGTSGPIKLSLPSGFTLAVTASTTTIIGSGIFLDAGVGFLGGMAIYNEDPYVQLIQGGGGDFVSTVVASTDCFGYSICVPLA